jgi:hypothetical protein
MQLDFFGSSSPPPSSASPIVGLKVQLPQACTCGSYLGVIGSSTGPHAKRVTCDACNVFRQWLGHREADFLATISEKFGAPSSPIILRGGRDGHLTRRLGS